MNKKEKIAANVVTYNRKDLLKECLNSLLSQTRKPDSIIIVDNNSNDGTREMLEKEFLDNPIFDYVRLDENTGSAGGQYTGIKRAYENGFDWVWCMDDDTIVEKDALKELIQANKRLIENGIKNIGFLASNVRWVDDSQAVMNVPRLTNNWGNNNSCLNMGYLEIMHNSFVSILINRKAIKNVGYPLKEFFIWLDDVEYSQRVFNFGCKNYLIIPSKVIHKTDKNNGTSLRNLGQSNKFKYKYLFRNRTYLAKQAKGAERFKLFTDIFFAGVKLLFLGKVNFFFTLFLPSFVSGLFFNPKSKKEIPSLD